MEERDVVKRERSRLNWDVFWWKSFNDLLMDWMRKEGKNSTLAPRFVAHASGQM